MTDLLREIRQGIMETCVSSSELLNVTNAERNIVAYIHVLIRNATNFRFSLLSWKVVTRETVGKPLRYLFFFSFSFDGATECIKVIHL